MDRATWQRERAVLCHDHLKNAFLPSLRGAVNSMEGKIEGTELEDGFFDHVLQRWAALEAAADRLLRTFLDAASPAPTVRQWLATRKCAWDLEWLPALTDALWMAQERIDHKMTEASGALEMARVRFHQVQAARLEECDVVHCAELVRSFGDSIQELIRRLQALTPGFERP